MALLVPMAKPVPKVLLALMAKTEPLVPKVPQALVIAQLVHMALGALSHALARTVSAATDLEVTVPALFATLVGLALTATLLAHAPTVSVMPLANVPSAKLVSGAQAAPTHAPALTVSAMMTFKAMVTAVAATAVGSVWIATRSALAQTFSATMTSMATALASAPAK